MGRIFSLNFKGDDKNEGSDSEYNEYSKNKLINKYGHKL